MSLTQAKVAGMRVALMPTFLWSGKTADGQEAVERVDAETAEEARAVLEARGWTELKQHTTDIQDFVQEQFRAATDPKYHPNLTPKQELANFRGEGPSFWGGWMESMLRSYVAILVIAGGLALQIYDHSVVGIALCAGLLAAVLLLFPVLKVWFGQTPRLFHKLHEARNWRRWDEVLQCLDQLQKAQQLTKLGIRESEMARYRALALAGLGRLEDGIKVFSDAAEKANMPQWLFHAFLARIYTTAKQYDPGLRMYQAALAEATDKLVVWLDTQGGVAVSRVCCGCVAGVLRIGQQERPMLMRVVADVAGPDP
jgi:tetratricopeptide (TPR) repeat protein